MQQQKTMLLVGGKIAHLDMEDALELEGKGARLDESGYVYLQWNENGERHRDSLHRFVIWKPSP